jgi:hypothetical protein
VPVAEATAATPMATVTATLPAGQTAAASPVPATRTPIPTVDNGATPPAPASDTVWLRIGLILAVMFLIVLVAFTRLRGGRPER